MEFAPTFKCFLNWGKCWKKRGECIQVETNPKSYLLSLLSVDWPVHTGNEILTQFFSREEAQIHVQGCTWLLLHTRIEWEPFSHSTRASFDTDPKGLWKIGFIPPIFWASDYQSDSRWEYLHSISLSQSVIPTAAFFRIQRVDISVRLRCHYPEFMLIWWRHQDMTRYLFNLLNGSSSLAPYKRTEMDEIN